VIGAQLGPWGLGATTLAIIFSWAYSMPPVRLKQNGWWGNLACAMSYEGLAWITGAALLSITASPSQPSLLFAGLYSLGAHGIMTLNDFKAIEGDQKMGIRSLPVQLGANRAAQVACLIMLIPQCIVIGFLFFIEQEIHAFFVGILVLAQLALMRYFLFDPIKRALFYSGFGVPLFVGGMMVAAFGIRNLGGQ
jgi:chlorophyll synthase